MITPYFTICRARELNWSSRTERARKIFLRNEIDEDVEITEFELIELYG